MNAFNLLPFMILCVLILRMDTVSVLISPMAVSTVEHLAVPGSHVAVLLQKEDLLLGQLFKNVTVPVTVWNLQVKRSVFTSFVSYVTQGMDFQNPVVVFAVWYKEESFRMVGAVPWFEKYYSNIQWVFSVRNHAEVLEPLRNHLCQVITVTETEINVSLDGYKSCEIRLIFTAAHVLMRNQRQLIGTYPRNHVIRYAVEDDGAKFCFGRPGAFGGLLREVYSTLNNTLVQLCNLGHTDSLLLDRRVDFVIALLNNSLPFFYYRYALLSPISLSFLSRQQGPVQPTFVSTWLNFFVLSVLFVPLAAMFVSAFSAVSSRDRRQERRLSAWTGFFVCVYMGRSPPALSAPVSSAARFMLAAWVFGMFFLLQFTQTQITASQSVPEFSSALRRIEDFTARLDAGSVLPCMHIAAVRFLDSHGNVSHLKSLRHALKKCGGECLGQPTMRDCADKARNETHILVHWWLPWFNGGASSARLMSGEDYLFTYLQWYPMHGRLPARHQHRRLLLALEESGLVNRILGGRPRPNSKTSHVAFDIPFSDYAAVYAVGSILALLTLAVEVICRGR
ncbi:uncharacterized protein LOC142584773 [Dermacentor variabilis]|uniref:uncharacterized protein LOC142584773 n=1 Tax=Dermacentor variabilis TaxID=34621 RepID=UPI003F5C6094